MNDPLDYQTRFRRRVNTAAGDDGLDARGPLSVRECMLLLDRIDYLEGLIVWSLSIIQSHGIEPKAGDYPKRAKESVAAKLRRRP